MNLFDKTAKKVRAKLGGFLFVRPSTRAAKTTGFVLALWTGFSGLSVAGDDFAARRQRFLSLASARPGHSVCTELARLAMGQEPFPEPIMAAVRKIDRREDCADFVLHDLLRLLYQFGDSSLIDKSLRQEIVRAILGFKYWPEEPGIDSMCTWTENHYILFSSGAYLAGQLFPDSVFVNSGRTGREMMARFRPRILRWLDLRFRTGFNEWLSNVYYALDIAALTNLADFCRDDEIALRARMVLDLLLADVALNQFRGSFACTHGRSYKQSKTDATQESTASVCALLFGMNVMHPGNRPATYLALSDTYRLPRVLYEIALDTARTVMINRQRMSIRIEEAHRWGLDHDSFEDGMLFLSYGAYFHPLTVDLMMQMLDRYRWWDNWFFLPFREKRTLLKTLYSLRLLAPLTKLFQSDLARNLRTEVNVYTYRTPYYMLSTAQDYRKGEGGDQHHIWSAALGPRAICFTTHPPRISDEAPNYWVGSGRLPRAAQVKNVTLVLYKFNTRPALYVRNRFKFTHAWFPREEFDEVVEKDGWILGRKGRGYIALWSWRPYRWQDTGEDAGKEVIAEGTRNVWICEMGDEEQWGSFDRFVRSIVTSEVRCDRDLNVIYESPSQGKLEFSWKGPLLQNGVPVPLNNYARYDNPYAQVPFPCVRAEFRHRGHWLRLDWEIPRREADEYIGTRP